MAPPPALTWASPAWLRIGIENSLAVELNSPM